MVAERKKRRAELEPATRAEAPSGAAAAAQLDDVIHGRLRLGIMSALGARSPLSFGELRQVLGCSDGNLSIHAHKLEQAGYVECRKYFAQNKPRTEFTVTTAGKRALARYLSHMEAIIAAARHAT